MIITIDGLSGCGKSSVARSLCKIFNLPWLDSGAIYRILAYFNRQNNNSLMTNLEILKKLNIEFKLNGKIILNNEEISCKIRNTEIAECASKIAKEPIVRKELLSIQQNFATPIGLIADGRDMGTKVFPNANIKFFLTAKVENRAYRRQQELQSMGENVSIESLIESINIRDCRDLQRKIDPVKPANDAYIIDTSNLSLSEVVGECKLKVDDFISTRFF